MTMTSYPLASGPGWQVRDQVCNSGPGDRPFEEQHEATCIAVVTEGSFQYRTHDGAAVLVPGAILLGAQGSCYECGHEHVVGDRCLSFQYAPEYLEGITASVPGASGGRFAAPHLPPLPRLMRLVAEAEAARDGPEAEAIEELAARLAGTVLAVLADAAPAAGQAAWRDRRRISDTLRRIEAEAHEPLSLAELARGAGLSPYHFLRTFRAVTGMTPHQYVLRTRLHRAAVRLRRTGEPVSAIALDVGFNDLSTFNRRFRRLMGMSPAAFRRSR